MATATTPAAGTSLLDKKMKKGPGLVGGVIFATIILGIFPGRVLSVARAGAATFAAVSENNQ